MAGNAAPETIPVKSDAQNGVTQAARMGAFYAAFGKAKEHFGDTFKQRKPWGELLDRSSFSRPENFAEASSRVRKNLTYFRVNYMIVVLITLALCIVFNPGSLIVICTLMAAWLYVFVFRSAPLQIGSRTLSEREKLLGLSAISFITVFFLTSVGTVLFSALVLGLTVIALHGATRVPDDLFIDDAAQSGGLWSAITGGANVPAALSTNV